ncbi:1484_t:CDS:1, partial [Cetraspora pellucida]
YISFVAVYFATIIGIAESAFLFLVLLAFIVFEFVHFLRPETKVSLIYPSYSSDSNDPWNLATTYNSITLNNDSCATCTSSDGSEQREFPDTHNSREFVHTNYPDIARMFICPNNL